ncbi:MAG: hypothetical protein MRZ79_22800 [Bacteroidia bacterium]|nr:hypothetical protein [Bacteroidia bacterium]
MEDNEISVELDKKNIPRKDEGFLGEVKKFFLKEDREVQDDINERLNKIEQIFHERERFDDKLEPYVNERLQEHVNYLQENYPKLFGQYLGEAIKQQIKDSQESIIDALYPIIGKLIGKFLRMELEKLSQIIDQRLQDPFSFSNLKLRVKAFFSGVKYEDLLISQMGNPSIEEIFLINKQNGLPLGHFSLDSVIKPQLVSGMLTGIKDFVEHAFEKEDTELETLQYDKYEIILFNFETFYFATIVEGQPHAVFKKELYDQALSFCEAHPVWAKEAVTSDSQAQVSAALKKHFNEINNQQKNSPVG